MLSCPLAQLELSAPAAIKSLLRCNRPVYPSPIISPVHLVFLVQICYSILVLGGTHLSYTNEEIGLIDGLIQSHFAPCSVSEQIRERYWETHQHMMQGQIGYSDLLNIRAALSFLLPTFDGERQIQKDLSSALAKTNALLKAAC